MQYISIIKCNVEYLCLCVEALLTPKQGSVKVPSEAGSRHSGSRHASSGRGAKPEAPVMPTVSNASAATSGSVVLAKSGCLGAMRETSCLFTSIFTYI